MLFIEKSLVHIEDTPPVDHPTPCRGRTPRQSIAAQSSGQMIDDVDAVGSSSTDTNHPMKAPKRIMQNDNRSVLMKQSGVQELSSASTQAASSETVSSGSNRALRRSTRVSIPPNRQSGDIRDKAL